MKRYYDRKTAPKIYHYLQWFIFIPLSFLDAVQLFWKSLSQGLFLSFPNNIFFIQYIIAIVSAMFCFIGFFRWKSYAWYSVIVYKCASFPFDVFFLLLTFFSGRSGLSHWIKSLVYDLTIVPLVILYYIKRRPLFFPEMIDSRSVNHEAAEQTHQ